MAVRILREGALRVIDYRCQAGPADAPYPEVHERYSLSYVRRGSFACRTLGAHHELLAGGFLVGRPGDEFTCTHEHHGDGDECLSIQLTPELLAELAEPHALWRIGALAPHARLAASGELAQAAAEGRIEVGLAEAALALVARFVTLDGVSAAPSTSNAKLRRVMARTADWMEAHASEDIDLLDAAREAALSPYHFLRCFHGALGVTPHQHLLRCRLRKAAAALLRTDETVTQVALDAGFGDLSNFVRTFRRAAGVSPGRYRRLGRQGSKNRLDLAPEAWLATVR